MVVPEPVAEIVAVVIAVTLPVAIVNVADVFPAGMLMLAGRVASDCPAERVIKMPPRGAAALSVTLPAEVFPPTTLVGLSIRDRIVGGVTVSDAVSTVPFRVAETVANVDVETEDVFTVNVAEDLPDGIVTDAGTVTTPLPLFSLTTIPLDGAAPLRVTVPTELRVPVTLDGLKFNPVKTGGSIVRTAVNTTVP